MVHLPQAGFEPALQAVAIETRHALTIRHFPLYRKMNVEYRINVAYYIVCYK